MNELWIKRKRNFNTTGDKTNDAHDLQTICH